MQVLMNAEKKIQANTADYPPVDVNDPLVKAVGLMFQYRCDVLPVMDRGRFVGVVKEVVLKGVLSGDAVRSARVGEATDFAVPWLRENMTIEEVTETIRRYPQESALPVVSEEGVFRGMVRARDLVAEMADVVRPPRVGGMATPFGVHLHCGSARGGSTDATLMLTGGFLMGIVGVAWVLTFIACWFLEKPLGLPLVPVILGSPVPVGGEGLEVAGRIIWVLPFLFFLTVLRFTRLAQYHAAEHMVVHAMEHFEPLTEESVRRMERVHPRCGSNLMVPALLLFLGFSLLPMMNRVYFVALAILIVATGRSLGGVAQALFTTRRPEKRHIEKAIGSARELLANYRLRGRRAVPTWVRIWNMGIVQTLLGSLLAYGMFFGLRALFERITGL